MKKNIVFIISFLSFLIFCSLIYADEQTEQAAKEASGSVLDGLAGGGIQDKMIKPVKGEIPMKDGKGNEYSTDIHDSSAPFYLYLTKDADYGDSIRQINIVSSKGDQTITGLLQSVCRGHIAIDTEILIPSGGGETKKEYWFFNKNTWLYEKYPDDTPLSEMNLMDCICVDNKHASYNRCGDKKAADTFGFGDVFKRFEKFLIHQLRESKPNLSFTSEIEFNGLAGAVKILYSAKIHNQLTDPVSVINIQEDSYSKRQKYDVNNEASSAGNVRQSAEIDNDTVIYTETDKDGNLKNRTFKYNKDVVSEECTPVCTVEVAALIKDTESTTKDTVTDVVSGKPVVKTEIVNTGVVKTGVTTVQKEIRQCIPSKDGYICPSKAGGEAVFKGECKCDKEAYKKVLPIVEGLNEATKDVICNKPTP